MRYWIGLIVLVLGVLLGIQNPEKVTLHWLSWSVDLPLAALLLVTLILGALFGWLLNPLQRLFRKKS